MTEMSLDEELKLFEDRKRKRQEAEESEQKRQRLAMLKLEEELEEKLGGKAGEAFVILDSPEGLCAFKLGDAVLYKRFDAEVEKNKERGGSGLTLETCEQFVRPQLAHPDAGAFSAMIGKRIGLLFRAAAALSALHTGKKALEDGKR